MLASSLSLRLAPLIFWVVSGCTDVVSQPAAVPSLDETKFHCHVEPLLIRDCSYLACHGNAGFPLRIYSVGKLRAGDASTLEARTAPLTDAERHANFLSAAAFAFGGVAPDDNLLLRKPMPTEAGGYEHLGGATFTGPDDTRAAALRSWLAGTSTVCLPEPGP
jgi:hypothetical protein